MRIRPSYKRLHYETWRDWQKEAYLGMHTGFTPADPEDVFEYPRHCPELNRIPVPSWGMDYTDRAAMDQVIRRAYPVQVPQPAVVSPQVQLRMGAGEPVHMRPRCVDRLLWAAERLAQKKSLRPRGVGQKLR